MKKILLTLVFLICSSKVFAVSGNDLQKWMIENERFRESKPEASIYQVGLYTGYVDGVTDVYQGLGVLCFRPKVTLGQTIDIVSKYIKQNPEQLDEDAHVIVRRALIKVFPCEQ